MKKSPFPRSFTFAKYVFFSLQDIVSFTETEHITYKGVKNTKNMPKIGLKSDLVNFRVYWVYIYIMGYVFTNKNMHNFNHFFSITISKYQILVKFGFENDPPGPPGG